jgi:hypothetical protein
MQVRPFASVAALCVVGAIAGPARADDQPSTAITLPYDIKFTGHVEVGTSINPDSPDNNVNFGQTFTDRANSIRMNQLMLNLERDLDLKNPAYQWGFKLTGMYGTDARVTHFLNEFDRATTSPYQFDIVEADVQAHLPYWFGGTDVKLGQYPTPLGAEVIDATGNTFYSHSYIFNYGLPFKHTGLLTTTHVSDMLDVWLGLDTGVNNSIGQKGMANNYFPKFLFGVGLNGLMGGNLSILALAHLGPENPRFAEGTSFVTNQPAGGPLLIVNGANNHFREYYDIVTTYKISDALSTTNELNFVHDDLGKASAGGIAQYLTYALDEQWSLGGRIEAFADQGKFATTGFAGFACVATESLDYVNAQRGLAPNLGYCGNLGNYNVTYGEITLGATYRPPLALPVSVMIRPEIRYDTVIGGGSGVKPFDVTKTSFGSGATGTNTGTKTSQVTLAVDLIVGF